MVAAVRDAHRRWPTGHYALWYPIKARGALDQFHGALVDTGLRKLLRIEFVATPDQALRGAGLIVINPPWRIEDQVEGLLAELGPALGRPDAARKIDWLVRE